MRDRPHDPLRRAYAEAGVDVGAGDRAVALIAERLRGSVPDFGGFASALPLPLGYREPVLVSATDGVGTKTAIARAVGRYDTLGQDLVAMCADDVVCRGARPLFFLDYLAVGRLHPERVAELVRGIADACEVIGCRLLGGETAEHPGLMEPDALDVAGFCVGIAERKEMLDGTQAREGDVLIGLASSGLHANGYSLVRAVVAEARLDLGAPYGEIMRRVLGRAEAERVDFEEPDEVLRTLGEVLLTPTRLYAGEVLALRDALADRGLPLRGLAHITGGGLPGNVPRTLPPDLGARVDTDAWPVPSVFRLFGQLAHLDKPELRATFNGGIGMVAVVDPAAETLAAEFLRRRGIASWPIGRVEATIALGGARYIESQA